MKTLIDVKNEINDLREQATLLHPRDDKRKISAIKKRLKLLSLAENYLLGTPGAEYLYEAKAKTLYRLRDIMKRTPFDRADKNPETKKALIKWDREEGVEKMKQQIKFMNYLIS